MNRFCVIGSLNVDLVVAADRLPRPSETVIAKDFQINPAGGKGANQAVALARLGAEVSLVGKVEISFTDRSISSTERSEGRLSANRC